MPIVVKHGGSFGNAGQIAAQAIQAELQQKADRAKQMDALRVQGAIASHQAQMRYHAEHEANQTAIRIAAMKSGLAQDMQREEYLQSLMQAKEAGKQAAQQTEYTYTTKQRIEDAKFARAEQAIKTNPRFSQPERDEALRRLAVARAGIREPVEILGDPNKPKYPEGKEPGQVWAGAQDGGWTQGYFTTDPKTGTAKLLVRPDQTPEYQQQKAQVELETKKLELQAKREEKIADLRSKLLSDETRIVGPDGKAIYRRRTPEEVDEIVSTSFGIERQVQPKQAEQGEQPWWQRVAQAGFSVEESDISLPEEVGGSVAFIRTMNARYGDFDNVPDKLKKAYMEAARVVRAYSAQRKSAGERTEYPSQSKFKPRS